MLIIKWRHKTLTVYLTYCLCVFAGATIEEVQKHWKWLDQNLLPYMAVFENKEDAASFVHGKVKVRPPYRRTQTLRSVQTLNVSICVGFNCWGGSGQSGCSGRWSDTLSGRSGAIRAALRPPSARETGDALLLLLLEGPRAAPGLAVPHHQPHRLLLLPTGQRGWGMKSM